ncbi:MAG: lysine exporter LysO family protein [Muribaculaceae bacterium]|nr:lysine exporter LysO family protein [Muribaculaceae bacterium]
MKGSLIIISFFVLGIVCGVMHWLPDLNALGNVSFWTLCGLLFCVGITVGNNTTMLKTFRNLDPRLMLLPLMTIVGTLSATAIASIGLPHRSLTDCLAIGSGFGYYSLSSIFITQYRGPELGTVALLANIIREVFTLLGAPLLVKYFGPLAPISSGGATTMDTTLPIITRCSGQDFVIVSLFHGFLVDFSVPFLVTFFCTLD